jgi:exodeoxyribonuclease VII large subunit
MKLERVSVTELTSAISYLLTEGIGSVEVIGEISNYKPHSSGHRYFSLKDEGAQVSAVMWKSRNLTFEPKEGMKVIAKGAISVYPPRGQYQLDCQSMRPLGAGDLFAAFEALKSELQAKGYFDQDRKKRIQGIPMKIAVITSPTGAAVQDILSTINRRFPAAEIYFRPALVQGEGSAEDIAKSIKECDKLDPDIIICGRGGGSIEDLWSFNTKIVADAIFACKALLISAVGHETDFTIADFVADLRAATPTAAAEFATPILKSDLIQQIENNNKYYEDELRRRILDMKKSIDNGVKSYGFRKSMERIRILQRQIDDYSSSFEKNLKRKISDSRRDLDKDILRLNSLNPMSPLNKGFALIKKNESFLKNSDLLVRDDTVTIIRKNQETKSIVL